MRQPTSRVLAVAALLTFPVSSQSVLLRPPTPIDGASHVRAGCCTVHPVEPGRSNELDVEANGEVLAPQGARADHLPGPGLLQPGQRVVASLSTEVEDVAQAQRLTDQAEAMMWFGLAENGRVREFAKALELLDRADELLVAAEMPDADRTRLKARIETLREDLTFHLERSRRRFLGTFPLARLIVPFPMMAQNVDLTETVQRESANEAVREAAERIVEDIIRLQYPHVVFRSAPHNRAFENEAMRVFASANRPFAHSRVELVSLLTPTELEAYDRDELDSGALDRLMKGFGASKLLVLTIRQDVDLPDGTLVLLEGVFFERGSEAETDSFVHMGFSRERRNQLWRMVLGQVILFAIALVIAARTPWRRIAPWPILQRIAMGVGVFLVGRVFAPLAVMVLRPVIPYPDAAASSSWWWPALLGVVAILGSGFVAWLAQGRVARVVPGHRTSRAVGMIFALAALGACAYFIEPLLLLNPSGGPYVFVPFVLASALLAGLTGYAIRTGPPVPTYFVLGPAAVAPLVGMAFLAQSPPLLWATVAASGVLCALAVVRHRYAVAKGLEEAEPDEEAAEQTDLERLEKLGKGLGKGFPV